MSTHNFSEASLTAAWQLIMQARTITLLPHYKPDGDALSSCAALEYVLHRHDKQVETIYPGGMPSTIPTPPNPLHKGFHSIVPNLLISCDTANAERLYLPEEFADVPLIVIDHHISNSLGDRATHTFMDATAASTCELLYSLLQTWGERIDTELANRLMFGVLTDTQCFRTSNTTASTLRIAADLVEAGADLNGMAQRMTQHKDENVIALWGMLMSHVKRDGSGLMWAVCLQEDLKEFGVDESALEGFVNQLAQMTPMDITALFYEQEDGSVKVSFRSKERDVNALAGQFGGGGHIRAAGMTSTESIKETIKKVMHEVIVSMPR